MNSFHRFLISRRVFCGIGSCMRRATRVLKDQHGKDVCVCDNCQLPTVSVGETEWSYQPLTKPKPKNDYRNHLYKL